MIHEYKIDTDTCTEPEEQLRFLMMEDVVFVNNGWHNESQPKDHITVHVTCNDVFAWACGDAEDLLYGEIEDLFNHYVKDPKWGTAVWCIKKRKWPPQTPVYDRIKKDGIWPIDEILKGFEEK